MISPLLADIIGLAGSALMIGGFAYANMAKDLNKLVFNLLNLAGAILLLISLSVKFNLGAFVLEAVWAVIALGGIVTALRSRRIPKA
jgi:predicted membrane protein